MLKCIAEGNSSGRDYCVGSVVVNQSRLRSKARSPRVFEGSGSFRITEFENIRIACRVPTRSGEIFNETIRTTLNRAIPR